jgi:exosortase
MRGLMSKFFSGVSPEAALRLAVPLGLGVLLLWAYLPTLAELGARWTQDPHYADRFLVPGFSAFLLWFRRPKLSSVVFRPCWWGVPFLLAATGLRLAGTYFYLDWLAGASLVLCLAGFCVLLGGRPALGWAWPALAFLLFMLPLPYRLEAALSLPLRQLATWASTFVLQALGFAALADGNVILVNDTELKVAEACSGLSMLVTFFALATAMVLVLKLPPVDKAFLVGSAIPIAVLANIVRITATAVLHETAGGDGNVEYFHDLAGWFMMPFALLMFWLEVKLLSHLFIEIKPAAGGDQTRRSLDLARNEGRAKADSAYLLQAAERRLVK